MPSHISRPVNVYKRGWISKGLRDHCNDIGFTTRYIHCKTWNIQVHKMKKITCNFWEKISFFPGKLNIPGQLHWLKSVISYIWSHLDYVHVGCFFYQNTSSQQIWHLMLIQFGSKCLSDNSIICNLDEIFKKHILVSDSIKVTPTQVPCFHNVTRLAIYLLPAASRRSVILYESCK